MERLNNRWGYAFVAFLCSLTVLPVMGFLLGGELTPLGIDSPKSFGTSAQMIGVPSFMAALICWPTFTKRTHKRMVLTGLLTVILAFMLMPVMLSVMGGKFMQAVNLNGMLGWLMLGSIMTYGYPYILGMFVASAFVDYSLPIQRDKSPKGKLLKRFAVEESTR